MKNQLFNLKISLPSKICFDGQVTQVRVFTPEGYCGILHGHIPMVAAIKTNFLYIHLDDGKILKYIANKGLCQVDKEGVKIVLDFFEKCDEVNIDILESRNKRIVESLENSFGKENKIMTNITKAIDSEIKTMKKLVKET